MAVTITKKKPPSNKTETLPNSPFIDKISIVLKPHTDETAHEIYMALFQTLDDHTLWANGSKGTGFQIGKRVLLPSIVDFKRLPLLQVAYGKSSKKVERIRLEFVPVDLGPMGMAELHAAMMMIVPGGWEYVASYAHVTRIDVTVDLPGVRMDGFQFLPKQASTTTRWTLNGVLQNVAYGKPKGNQTLIYNRKTKRLSKGQSWDGVSVVRIERRLVSLGGMKLHALSSLPNPFAGMVLTKNMPAAPVGVDEGLWSMFGDSVQVRGLKDALALLKKERRTKFRKHMTAHPLPWWNPDEIWKNWQPMLASLKIASTQWPG